MGVHTNRTPSLRKTFEELGVWNGIVKDLAAKLSAAAGAGQATATQLLRFREQLRQLRPQVAAGYSMPGMEEHVARETGVDSAKGVAAYLSVLDEAHAWAEAMVPKTQEGYVLEFKDGADGKKDLARIDITGGVELLDRLVALID